MTIYASGAYLQTRGTARASDYTFLGEAPHHPWWREYRDTTAFDHPTLLVTSDGYPWHAYLSGIPSARTDAVGTVVRYTLVLTGGSDDSLNDCGLAAVAAWLDDIAAGTRTGRFHGTLASALDAQFPADEVDRLIAARPALVDHPAPEHDFEEEFRRSMERTTGLAAVEERVVAALRTLPGPPLGGWPDDWPDSWPGGRRGEPLDDWLGAVTDPAARAAFVARVAMLVNGWRGRALLLNLIGGPQDVQPLLRPASPVAVLVESTDPQSARYTALRPVVEAKKAVPPPARRAGTAAAVGIAVLPLVALIGALAMTALVVTLLIWLL
jgi:hypothetical protein